MTLSKRASDFLMKSERESSLLTKTEIRQIFVDNKAPVFEPLIDFQQTFGGYIFYSGLVPKKFSLLKKQKNAYPKYNGTPIIEFEISEFPSSKYFFDCAITDYQMQFYLDEQGIYYEDYEAKASNFGKIVEHLALWDEMNLRKDFELVFRDRRLQTNNIEEELKVDLLPEASDQYTQWFKNEDIYLQQWQGLTTIIASKSFSEKDRLLSL